MSLSQTLNKTCESFFEELSKRNTKDISWAFNVTPEWYNTDYNLFKTYGGHKSASYFNQMISSISIDAWKWLVVPKILKTIFDFFDQYYAPIILKQDPKNAPSAIESFKKNIQKGLISHVSELAECSFTDYFAFQFLCIEDLLNELNIETDLFKALKDSQVKEIIPLYTHLKRDIDEIENPITAATYLAARANWLDLAYDGHQSFPLVLFEEAAKVFSNKSLNSLIFEHPHFNDQDHLSHLQKDQDILYELDNSGEVIMDLFLIEQLINNGHRVTISAKSRPALNDVTIKDLHQILQNPVFSDLNQLMGDQLKLIENGSYSVGHLIWQSSDPFIQAYEHCDLMILKGQGHFHSRPIKSIDSKFKYSYQYKKPALYLMGIRSELTISAVKKLIPNPQAHSIFSLYQT